MRVILQGGGRLTIDVLGSHHEPGRRDAGQFGQKVRETTETARPLVDLDACTSLEEALFAGAVFLLQRHYARIGGAPTRKVIAAARQIFEVLSERGALPNSNPADTAFLAKLLAILEQITDDGGKPFFTDLIGFVRDLILNGEDDTTQNGSNGSPGSDDDDRSGGNGTPDNNGGLGRDDLGPPARKPGGNNGTPSNGSSL